MTSVSALGYPPWGVLGYSSQERLVRFTDAQEYQTQDSWLIHFLNFTNVYNLIFFWSNDIIATNVIMTNCMIFLLCGHNIKGIEIKADTIKIYMRAVNKYYVENNYHEPFDGKLESDVARLLKKEEFLNKTRPRENHYHIRHW